MAQNRFSILLTLAVLMHLMVQVAPLWMPVLSGGGQTIQICSSQGIETITLDKNGVPIENSNAPKHDCPFCLAQTTLSLNAPALAPLITPEQPKDGLYKSAHDTVFAKMHRNPAHLPRAPPAFS